METDGYQLSPPDLVTRENDVVMAVQLANAPLSFFYRASHCQVPHGNFWINLSVHHPPVPQTLVITIVYTLIPTSSLYT